MKWGLTLDFMIQFQKVISDSISHATSVGKSVTKVIADTLNFATDIPTLTLSIDDQVWQYTFASATPNAAAQVVDTFTKASDASSTQTQSSDPSTTWTDA